MISEKAVADHILAELQRITRLAAGPSGPCDNVKSQIADAAQRLGISYRRARSFWYAAAGTAPRAAEIDRLRAAETRLLRQRRAELVAELDDVDARLADACRCPYCGEPKPAD